jgi:pimeloyl-ACP methyl ester carboxylesterase
VLAVLLTLAGLLPCSVPDVEGPARCGSIEVREDPGAHEGRRIGLKVVVLPATQTPAEGAVFILAGGPGQAATRLAPQIASEHAATRKRRDIVLVDQRGTGGSNPLPCRPYPEQDLRLYLGPDPPPDFVGECRKQLEARANLAHYTTWTSALDLEEVRSALGYPRIDLDGGSYGTRLALVYMRAFPGRVRTAVLKAVNPPSYRLPLPFARAAQEALDRLFADCAADTACARAYPDLARKLGEVLERLERAPARVRVKHPVSGRDEDGLLTRKTFAARLFLMLFSPELSSRIPGLIERAHAGDLAPFAQLAVAFGRAIFDQIDFGQQLSVLCAEDVPFIREEDIAAATRGTFLRDDPVRGIQGECRFWPRGELPPDFFAPVRVDVPTLLISGALDPVTPPRFAEEVAATLPRARHLVLEHATHLGGGACLEDIVTKFIDRGDAAALDVACLAGIRRPPFELPAAVSPR